MIVRGQRQQPGKGAVAAALTQRKLAVRLVVAHAERRLQRGRRLGTGLFENQIDRYRRRTAEFGRSAAHDLDALQLGRRQAADHGLRHARIAGDALAVDEHLYRIARHAARPHRHRAVRPRRAGIDAGQLAEHVADGQRAHIGDFAALDDDLLRRRLAAFADIIGTGRDLDFGQDLVFSMGRQGEAERQEEREKTEGCHGIPEKGGQTMRKLSWRTPTSTSRPALSCSMRGRQGPSCSRSRLPKYATPKP